MRIAFVAARFHPDVGGIETVMREVSSRLAAAGDDVEVFTHASRAARAGSTTQDGLTVHRYRVPLPHQDLAISPGLYRALRRARGRFDVVHAHNYHASPPLSAALAGSCPIVFSPYYHGGGHTRLARLAHLAYRPASSRLFRASAHIICISPSEASKLAADVPGIEAPVTVIPMGVDGAALASATAFEETHDIVLAVARMDPYKRLDRLVLATKELPERFRTVLVGDGPARPELERLVASHGLGARVQITGRVASDDLRRWYRTARVVVTMSEHESFGLTVIEALAAGAAVVASDIPAHRDTASTQPAGAVHLVDPDSAPHELARAIAESADSGLPGGVGVASWDDVAASVRSIYETVAATGSSRCHPMPLGDARAR